MIVAALTAWLVLSSGWQDPSRAARVDAVFKDYDSTTSPGCAVAVFQDDKILYKRAYGMANLDHDVRLSTSSVFHVASVSKQFTAAAILLLAQDGKLALDDDIRKHVPELPDFGTTITIRQLANHTSGIRDQWDLLGLAGWRYSRDLITDDDVLELLARQKDLNFTPGARHMYSNSGYTLLAVIVSRVSGKSFREFTTERIFAPLGMTNTHFRDTFTEIVKNQAYGYAPYGQTFRLSTTNFDTAGATSLLTTVEDMAKWYANFDTGKVGGGKLLAGLLDRGVLKDGTRIDYAFGMTHGTYRGVRDRRPRWRRRRLPRRLRPLHESAPWRRDAVQHRHRESRRAVAARRGSLSAGRHARGRRRSRSPTRVPKFRCRRSSSRVTRGCTGTRRTASSGRSRWTPRPAAGRARRSARPAEIAGCGRVRHDGRARCAHLVRGEARRRRAPQTRADRPGAHPHGAVQAERRTTRGVRRRVSQRRDGCGVPDLGEGRQAAARPHEAAAGGDRSDVQGQLPISDRRDAVQP